MPDCCLPKPSPLPIFPFLVGEHLLADETCHWHVSPGLDARWADTFSVYYVGCVAAGAPAVGSLLSLRQQSTGLLSAEASAFRRCLRNSFRLPRYQKRSTTQRVVLLFLVEARGVEHLQDINRKIKVICLQK